MGTRVLTGGHSSTHRWALEYSPACVPQVPPAPSAAGDGPGAQYQVRLWTVLESTQCAASARPRSVPVPMWRRLAALCTARVRWRYSQYLGGAQGRDSGWTRGVAPLGPSAYCKRPARARRRAARPFHSIPSHCIPLYFAATGGTGAAAAARVARRARGDVQDEGHVAAVPPARVHRLPRQVAVRLNARSLPSRLWMMARPAWLPCPCSALA